MALEDRVESGQYAQCRHARNPHHKCTEACLSQLRRQNELYGPPESHTGTPHGRWTAQQVSKLGNAEPIDRTADAADTVAAYLCDGTSSPIILLDQQKGWRAAQLWSLEFFREAFGEESVLCADKVPSRRTDSPPGQTLRVCIRELIDYCKGLEVPQIASAEMQGRAFQLAEWSFLGTHSALEEHFNLGCVPDRTPVDTPPRRELSRAMTRLLLAPPGAATRLHTPERGTHLCLAQVKGRRQVVLYPPSKTEAVYGNCVLEGQSAFDPFRPQFDKFPLARGAAPRTAVLEAGDILVVPSGWWYADIALSPSVALARNFVSEGPTLRAFTAELEAAEAGQRSAAAAPASSLPAASPARSSAAAAVAASAALLRSAAPPTSVAGVSIVPESKVDPQDDTSVDVFQRAKRHRELGNSLFHAGRLREATEAYTRAVELLELEELEEEEELSQLLSTARAERGEVERGALAVCLSNRAACWLRRKQWRLALADCNRVIRSGRMDSLVVKAYFRRGKAHEGLGDADAALADFRRVAELQPYNKEAAEELESYRSILHRLTVMSSADADTRRRQMGR